MRPTAFLDQAELLCRTADDEVKALENDIRERLDLSESEIEARRSFIEALYRTSVSRAYYAVYHFALDVAITLDFKAKTYRSDLKKQRSPVASSGVHELLWHWFSDQGYESIGSAGTALKRLRTLSDYKIKEVWRIDASTALEEANELVELIYKILDPEPSGQLRLL